MVLFSSQKEDMEFVFKICVAFWFLGRMRDKLHPVFLKFKENTKIKITMSGCVRSIMFTCSLVAITFGALSMLGVVNVEVSSSYVDDDPKFVTYQSAIKLALKFNSNTFVLNSLTDQNYGSGSGQQVVTFSPKLTDQVSLWVVREADGDPQMEAGKPVKCGSVIRLTHNSSNRNLHSHLVRSSLSGNQEISGFGKNGEGDASDDWKVICMKKHEGGYWQRDGNKQIRLQHIATKKYLMADAAIKFTQRNCGGSCPILNHLEAYAQSFLTNDSLLSVAGGVHLSL